MIIVHCADSAGHNSHAETTNNGSALRAHSDSLIRVSENTAGDRHAWNSNASEHGAVFEAQFQDQHTPVACEKTVS